MCCLPEASKNRSQQFKLISFFDNSFEGSWDARDTECLDFSKTFDIVSHDILVGQDD